MALHAGGGGRDDAVRTSARRSYAVRRASLTLGTGLLFGLFPALHSTRPDLHVGAEGAGGQPSGARGAARFRLVLATAQIALSMALLVAAGLFVKSLLNVSRVDLGLKIDNVITFGVSPELNGYTPERTRGFFERLEDELAARAGRHRRRRSRSCRCSPAATGAPTSPSRASRPGRTPTTTRASTRSAPAISDARHAADGRPRVHRRRRTRRRTKVAIVNEAFAKKFNLGATRSAS